jgi:hypothetical protein
MNKAVQFQRETSPERGGLHKTTKEIRQVLK